MSRRGPGSAGVDASRRVVLAAVAATTAALAGCAYEEDVNYEAVPEPVEDREPIGHHLPDLPVHEHVETVESGVEAGREATVDDEASFLSALDERGIDVASLERDGRFLLLEYVADAPGAGVLADLGVVAGAFVPYAVASADPGRLEATLLEADGDPFGSFDVLVVWARAHDEGELPLESYAELVAATLGTTREAEE